MKKDIHPKYFTDIAITCACGKKISTGSTVEKIAVELCSQCHPFYTGKQKLVDTARRVEKFTERGKRQAAASEKRHGKKVKREKLAKLKMEKKAKAEKEEGLSKLER